MSELAPFSLRQLHYFVSVARAGQISAAATAAHISQSAMTTAIAELERLLGAQLFERSRSGVTLTFEGHHFLQQAQAVLDLANQAARFPFQRRTDVAGRLELAASYTVLGYFVLPAIAKFKQLFPLVEVVPVELSRPEIERGLRSGQIELAVALLSNLEQREALHTHILTRSRRQLWVAAQHELADAGRVGVAQIAAFPYILPMMDEGDRNAMKYWADAGLQPTSVMKTSSMEALREMVALGLGVTILSDMVFRPWSLDGRRIRSVEVEWPLPLMEVGLAWQRDTLSPPAAAVREFLTRSGVDNAQNL